MNSPATLAASRVVIRVWAVKLATGRFARCDSSLLNHREEKHHWVEKCCCQDESVTTYTMQTRCKVLVVDQQSHADCDGQHDAMKFKQRLYLDLKQQLDCHGLILQRLSDPE